MFFLILGLCLAFLLCVTKVGLFSIFFMLLSAGTLLTAFCLCVRISGDAP